MVQDRDSSVMAHSRQAQNLYGENDVIRQTVIIAISNIATKNRSISGSESYISSGIWSIDQGVRLGVSQFNNNNRRRSIPFI